MKHQKGFSAVIILLLVVAVAGVALFLFSKKSTKDTNQISSKDISESGCDYGPMIPDMYLDKYIVKPGDTLLSIANNELGSTSRINEIINLNKNNPQYHSLYNSDVIEERWELYISSKYLPPNSGDLVASMGMLSVSTRPPFAGRLLAITNPVDFPSGGPMAFNDSAVFFGTNKFKAGDCVLVIRDEGTDQDIIMAIQKGPDTLRAPDEIFKLGEVEFPKEKSQCIYDFLGAEEVMRRYVVKTGDNLNSIAWEQLGDASRVNEIKEANKDRYASLKNSSFIEVEWELLLPPKWAVPSTGHLTGFSGTLLREENNEFWVSKDLSAPAQLKFPKASTVKYFGKDKFEPGDCVVILNNRSTALGISTQDVDYIELFKYGNTGN